MSVCKYELRDYLVKEVPYYPINQSSNRAEESFQSPGR
jgi:hypothetical protein